MLIDTGGAWPPSLITYSQDGQLVRSAPYLPLDGISTVSSSKCRFMECVGDSVFVVDLGMFSGFCVVSVKQRIAVIYCLLFLKFSACFKFFF